MFGTTFAVFRFWVLTWCKRGFCEPVADMAFSELFDGKPMNLFVGDGDGGVNNRVVKVRQQRDYLGRSLICWSETNNHVFLWLATTNKVNTLFLRMRFFECV